MTDEQSREVANFRRVADEKLIDHSSLTDEQVLLLKETLKRFSDALIKATTAAWEKIRQTFIPFLHIYEAEKKRQRRLYYRKKKSQKRNWRKRKKVR